MPLEDTIWVDEIADIAYRYDDGNRYDIITQYDGEETIWIDEEDA